MEALSRRLWGLSLWARGPAISITAVIAVLVVFVAVSGGSDDSSKTVVHGISSGATRTAAPAVPLTHVPTSTAIPTIARTPAPVGRPVPFETFLSGWQSGVVLAAPAVYKITTAQQLADILGAARTPPFRPVTTPPPVDFDSQMLIAVFDKSEPSGVYVIEINEIVAAEGGLVVAAKREFPGGSHCGATTENTHPFHAVLLDRFDGEPQLDLTDNPFDCE